VRSWPKDEDGKQEYQPFNSIQKARNYVYLSLTFKDRYTREDYYFWATLQSVPQWFDEEKGLPKLGESA
jgi:hypothetical protein